MSINTIAAHPSSMLSPQITQTINRGSSKAASASDPSQRLTPAAELPNPGRSVRAAEPPAVATPAAKASAKPLTAQQRALAASVTPKTQDKLPKAPPANAPPANAPAQIPAQADASGVNDLEGSPEPPVLSGPMMTVEGLMAAWGQSDSPYDLTGDGSVGVGDLLALLANGGTMPYPEATQETVTMSGLLAAWGQNHPTFDLNHDGVVDTGDLLLLLSKLGNGVDSGQNKGEADAPLPTIAKEDLPQGMTADALLELARTNPAATDGHIQTLMELLGAGEETV